MENVFILKVNGEFDTVYFSKDLAYLKGLKSGKEFKIEDSILNDTENVTAELEGNEIYIQDDYDFREQMSVSTYIENGETETDFISFTEEIIYTPFQKNHIDKIKFENILFSEMKISSELRFDIQSCCNDLIEKLDEELED
jgi:hypothetical protein